MSAIPSTFRGPRAIPVITQTGLSGCLGMDLIRSSVFARQFTCREFPSMSQFLYEHREPDREFVYAFRIAERLWTKA